MKKYRYRTLYILFALLLLPAGCSPVYEDTAETDFAPQINPYAEQRAALGEEMTLYFPMARESYLAEYREELGVSTGNTRERVLVTRLLASPPPNLGLTTLFWDGVQLKDINRSDADNLITVTLSSELLSPPPLDDDWRARCRTGIYAIVNTLTHGEEYLRVQILVGDEPKAGLRPKRGEVGFVGEGQDMALEPMNHKVDTVITPFSLVECALNAAQTPIEDYDRIQSLLWTDDSTPDADAIAADFSKAEGWILSYQLDDVTLLPDSQSARVSVDITWQRRQGENVFLPSRTVLLHQSSGVWRIQYDSLRPLIAPDSFGGMP